MVQELAAKESAGVDFLTAYLGSLRAAEAAKPHATEEARLNGYKGAIPSETRSGVRLIVAADADHNSLVSQGFTRIGDYKGSGVERGGKRGYYFSTVSGSSAYNQGVMQTVATSYNGVDPRTGYTVTGNVAGGSRRTWWQPRKRVFGNKRAAPPMGKCCCRSSMLRGM